MSKKITSKIVGFSVKSEEPVDTPKVTDTSKEVESIEYQVMDEQIGRPEVLLGATYKLKPPEHVSAHALYITINDVVLNMGTEREERRPFEIFINSKDMANFQWVVALTRIMSAVFRKGGDITFLVEELHSVFDPKGGYWDKGKYVNSLISQIGSIIEKHLIFIGMLEKEGKDPEKEAFLEAKRKEFEKKETKAQESKAGFPENATFCSKCGAKAVVLLDGCSTCLECGESKCG